MGACTKLPYFLSRGAVMKTCTIISCWRKQKCHLEEQGMEDLCPAVKEIVETAKEQTEKAWREQDRHSVVVPLDRFNGTVKTITDRFSIDVALEHMRNYDEARKKKFIKDRAFEKEWDVKIIDPGPLPQPWLPESENNQFYEGGTTIEDRSAVVTGDSPEASVKKLKKAHRIITKQEVEYLRELNARIKLKEFQDIREEKIQRILASMEI